MTKSNKLSAFAALFGIFMGALCALGDLLPNDDLWVFSSLSGSIGFWGASTALILLKSDSRLRAFINTFLYLGLMNMTFFITHFLMPAQIRADSLSSALFQGLCFAFPSAVCGVLALIVYRAKKDDKLGCFVLSLPIGVILAETVSLTASVFVLHKYLFQVLLDLIGTAVLFIVHAKNKNKAFVIISSVTITAVLTAFSYLAYKTILTY